MMTAVKEVPLAWVNDQLTLSSLACDEPRDFDRGRPRVVLGAVPDVHRDLDISQGEPPRRVVRTDLLNNRGGAPLIG